MCARPSCERGLSPPQGGDWGIPLTTNAPHAAPLIRPSVRTGPPSPQGEGPARPGGLALRRRKLHIVRFRLTAKARSFRCSSSPRRTRGCRRWASAGAPKFSILHSQFILHSAFLHSAFLSPFSVPVSIQCSRRPVKGGRFPGNPPPRCWTSPGKPDIIGAERRHFPERRPLCSIICSGFSSCTPFWAGAPRWATPPPRPANSSTAASSTAPGARSTASGWSSSWAVWSPCPGTCRCCSWARWRSPPPWSGSPASPWRSCSTSGGGTTPTSPSTSPAISACASPSCGASPACSWSSCSTPLWSWQWTCSPAPWGGSCWPGCAPPWGWTWPPPSPPSPGSTGGWSCWTSWPAASGRPPTTWGRTWPTGCWTPPSGGADWREDWEDLAQRLAQRRAALAEGLDDLREDLQDRAEASRQQLQEWRASAQELLDKSSRGQRRLLRAFPSLCSVDHRAALERLRRRLERK